MNDPIERLRAIAHGHAPASPDVDALVRRARRRRRREAEVAGAVVAGLALTVAFATGPNGAHHLSVAATPPAGSPAPTATPAEPSGSATPTAEPVAESGSPVPDEPQGTAEPTPVASPPPDPAVPRRALPRCWRPSDERTGEAPYYDERYAARAANRKLCGSPGTYRTEPGPASTTYVWYFDMPSTRGGDFTAVLGFCNPTTGARTVAYPTEQEADLVIASGATPAAATVYTWSRHRTFAATPHTERLGGQDCAVYVWRLPLVDDLGTPLVSGATYDIATWNTGNGAVRPNGSYGFRAP